MAPIGLSQHLKRFRMSKLAIFSLFRSSKQISKILVKRHFLTPFLWAQNSKKSKKHPKMTTFGSKTDFHKKCQKSTKNTKFQLSSNNSKVRSRGQKRTYGTFLERLNTFNCISNVYGCIWGLEMSLKKPKFGQNRQNFKKCGFSTKKVHFYPNFHTP